MRTILQPLLVLLSFAAASCTDVADNDSLIPPAARTINVTIGSGPRIDAEVESRTALGPDGVSVRWVVGDKIAMWAEKDGTFALDKHTFSLWHYNEEYDNAKFTADIPQMPQGTYNYYAVSPMPTATNGLKVSYDIPAVQSGAYDPACDVMVAQPVQGEALTEGDNSDVVRFVFQHKIHILRITIPTNNLGEDISEIELKFPVAVTGRMSIDAADPDAAPELTEGSNLLTLRFDQPKKAGDTVYAMIAPVAMTSDQTFSITALGQTCMTNPNSVPGRNLEAGHTTPIEYNIPVKGKDFTRLTFTLPTDKGTATLGEEVTSITLTAPADATFGNGENVLTYTPGADGSYTITFKPSWEDKLSGKSITVQHESVSAVVTNTITMPTITDFAANTARITVPYLMQENFDTVQTFSNNEGATGANNDPSAIWIPGLNGWSAARVGGQAGKSVRISCRREGGMWIFVNYEGRMDSAPLSNLKAGANVKIKASFNYSGSTSGNAPKFKYGTSNAQGAINGANDGIESQAGSGTTNTNGSYTNITQSVSGFTASATNQTRLAWVVYGENGGFAGGWFYYLYIDNVKVSIAK